YFDDNTVKDCGICDNCLAKKQLELSTIEFANIQEKILNAISISGINIKALQQNLKNIPKEKLQQVLEFLINENYLSMNTIGLINKKN
ncbi:MAG: RecQ family ATP-dependent DNA helicase, partial [Chitinophagaceae bacterium]|nr:RecQ family ATP-dependent DNA helicase [Chitinophagaceae bacterium]